jgi:hypothetical protein
MSVHICPAVLGRTQRSYRPRDAGHGALARDYAASLANTASASVDEVHRLLRDAIEIVRCAATASLDSNHSSATPSKRYPGGGKAMTSHPGVRCIR